MAETQFLVIQRSYDFARWILEHTQKFPKSLRFSLAVRVENRILEIVESAIVANRRHEKLPLLEQADRALDALRILIRLAYEMRVLAPNSYEYASQEMNEIGKLLGGWIKQQSRLSAKRG